MSSSSPTRNRERILEAIDQLRKRKARPDITRICNYLFRRFHVNSAEAKSDLEWCVAHNVVLKVEYKGNISYRNAAKKWAQMRNRVDNRPEVRSNDRWAPSTEQNRVDNASNDASNQNSIAKQAVSKNFMELLTNVFGELVVEEPDYLEIGVPPKEIIANILSKDSVRYTRNYIAILLMKEVERGNLLKLENGNFLLGPCADGKRTWTPREPERKMITSTPSQTYQSGTELSKFETELNQYRHFRGESSGHAISVQTDDTTEANREEQGSTSSGLVKPKKRMIAKMQAEKLRQLRRQQNADSGDEKRFSDTKSESGNLRYGGRRKKAKKVFDPSDNNIPKKRGRPAGSLNRATIEKQLNFNHKREDNDSRPSSRTSSGSRDHGGVCSVCHTQSRKGPSDRMVSCRECSNKAHYGCLNGDDMMLRMYPDNTWQCPHCKTCVVCYETSDAGNLIVCSICADGYHPTCHQPRVTDKIKNGQRWLCFNCQVTDKMKPKDIHIGESIGHGELKLNDDNDKDNNTSQSNSGRSSPYDSSPVSPTPPQSPKRKRRYESDQNSDSNSVKYSESEQEIDPSIPDATHWTADEVYEYFVRFFPEDAIVFKEQEIDGRSLLLLKRLDVLSSLNLKLGPALKIYRHVTMLQVRRDDRRLYWL